MESIFYYYVIIIWLFILYAAIIGSSIKSSYANDRIIWFILFIFFHFFLFLYIGLIDFKKLSKDEHKKIIYIILGYIIFVIVPLFVDHYIM